VFLLGRKAADAGLVRVTHVLAKAYGMSPDVFPTFGDNGASLTWHRKRAMMGSIIGGRITPAAANITYPVYPQTRQGPRRD
jgi:hypothetical protein